MKLLKELSRYLVGGLFIFSGIIKVNDPVGTAIKLEEYFEVFAYDFAPIFEWFIPAALFLSVFLSVLEVVLGIALIIGWRMRETAWALLLLIVFFTFLTFYSAYFNKVTDCGCFGDAIKLTPWESFTKDVILVVFIAVIFVFKDSYQPLLETKISTIIMSASTVVLVTICILAIRHLPFIDFRSYAIGNHLPTLMQPSGELKYEYVVEKDGEELSFENYPTEPGYKFISSEVLNPEVMPKITDLAVWNDEGDYTESLLAGTKLLIIVQGINKTSDANVEEISALLKDSNIEQWVLTSSSSEEYEAFALRAQWDLPYYFADATVLKTMVRSSPGIILMKDGTVVGKWHHNDTPEAYQLQGLIN
ncbi:MAG: DoxX family protein [Cyclobacteriaceae bacterium]